MSSFIVADRVQETCNAPGLGVVTLLGASPQFQSFSAAIGDTNTTTYAIADVVGVNWEAGIGTYSSSGNTLTRTTVLASSNGGAAVNFNLGTQNVWVDYPAEKAILLDPDGNISSVIGNISNITGAIKTPESITFDTNPSIIPTATGSIFWDVGDKTPSVLLDTDVSLQLGQENVALVYNGTGSTITKGSVVAVNGAQGQRPSVVLADADSEALSAPTLGIAVENILNGAEGFITTFGFVRGINTSTFTAGAPVYLSQTAGQFTSTRPSAPAHTVALGWVIKINASSGEVFVNINNGWELDELHNVLITSPISGNTLIYDAVAQVWKNANISAGTGISVTNGAGSISIANTGVTSVTGTSPVASSGGATPAISLAANYGDTQNPYASKTANYFLATPNGSAGVPTFRAVVAADIPTLNQNTSGTAAGLSATLVATSGGTGTATTAVGDLLQGAATNTWDKLAAVATGNALISGGVTTASSWGKIGLTTHVSGTLPIANGGTNSTATPTAGGVGYGTGTAHAYTNAGTANQILISNAASAPSFTTLAGSGISEFAAGTALLFQQTSAPTGWTKSTTHNDKALRVVSGAASSGGTVAFSTAFASQAVSGSLSSTTVTGTVGSTTLASTQIPSHTHAVTDPTHSHDTNTHLCGSEAGGYGLVGSAAFVNRVMVGGATGYVTSSSGTGISIQNTGGGLSHTHSLTMDDHTHTFTGTAINLAVQYVDIIIATKN